MVRGGVGGIGNFTEGGGYRVNKVQSSNSSLGLQTGQVYWNPQSVTGYLGLTLDFM